MKKELITHLDSKSPISEIFRTLRTNLQFMNKYRECESILVTSTVQSEGKSWVASNLAVAFAQTGAKTLLIDSDMRRPRQHRIFSVKSYPGLSNYLSNINQSGRKDDLNASDCIIETGVRNLWLFPAGNIPPNPSELLVSNKTEELLNEVSKNFDVVIFDGAPCLLVTDSTIISRMVGQTLLVTSSKLTKKEDLKKAKKRIDDVGGNIVGVVLNRAKGYGKNYKNNYYYDNKNSNSAKRYKEDVYSHIKDDIKQDSENKNINQNENQEPSSKAKEILNNIQNYNK